MSTNDTIKFLRFDLKSPLPIIIATAEVNLADCSLYGAHTVLKKPVQKIEIESAFNSLKIGSIINWKDGSQSSINIPPDCDMDILGMCQSVSCI